MIGETDIKREVLPRCADTVSNAFTSQSLLKPIVAQHNQSLKGRANDGDSAAARGEEIKLKVAQDVISKAKNKGISEHQYLAEAQSAESNSAWKLAMADIYM